MSKWVLFKNPLYIWHFDQKYLLVSIKRWVLNQMSKVMLMGVGPNHLLESKIKNWCNFVQCASVLQVRALLSFSRRKLRFLKNWSCVVVNLANLGVCNTIIVRDTVGFENRVKVQEEKRRRSVCKKFKSCLEFYTEAGEGSQEVELDLPLIGCLSAEKPPLSTRAFVECERRGTALFTRTDNPFEAATTTHKEIAHPSFSPSLRSPKLWKHIRRLLAPHSSPSFQTAKTTLFHFSSSAVKHFHHNFLQPHLVSCTVTFYVNCGILAYLSCEWIICFWTFSA